MYGGSAEQLIGRHVSPYPYRITIKSSARGISFQETLLIHTLGVLSRILNLHKKNKIN
jgi:hypothetical protein